MISYLNSSSDWMKQDWPIGHSCRICGYIFDHKDCLVNYGSANAIVKGYVCPECKIRHPKEAKYPKNLQSGNRHKENYAVPFDWKLLAIPRKLEKVINWRMIFK